jgi:lauroyl/myristoyl acyltransferase
VSALAAGGRTDAPHAQRPTPWQRLRSLAARFWLCGVLMPSLDHAPWLVRLTKPFFLWWAWHTSAYLRRNTLENARYLLGPGASTRDRRRLARSTITSHWDFISDFGRMRRWPKQRLLEEIESVEGEAGYREARALGRGVVLVTAHLGSFEVGLASLCSIEPVVYVVFKRDPMAVFDRLRSEQRRKLGVVEAPVDDGLHVWLELRDALRRDEVVLMQGDRALPGQKAVDIDFCGRPMKIPTGPARLALAAGAPLVPVFSVRTPNRKVRIVLEAPIVPDPGDPGADPLPIVRRLTSVIERYVRAYPEQWLMIHPAWEDDGPRAGSAPA